MDINKDVHKSHILLAKLLLKPYAFKTIDGKCVKLLDIKSNNIKQEKIQTLDAILNYYDNNMEIFLDKKIESPFGDTVDKIKHIFLKNKEINIKQYELNNIRKFFQYSVTRNKRFYNKMSNIMSPISINFDHSSFLCFTPATDIMFQKKQISIMISNKNNTSGFVCPYNVITICNLENTIYLIIAISSKIAIILDLHKESNQVDVIEVDDDIICKINCEAYLTEKYQQNKYLVGLEKDLIKLKENIIKYKIQ